MTTIMITRTIKVAVPALVAITWWDGWELYRNFMSPGLIRSNEALRGWKDAKADARAFDVDYV